MNITSLIVELLQQGKQVEMPGIGTLSSVMQDPHHDPVKNTFYPASRTIAFSTAVSGSGDMVAELARRECVSEEVAKQMWRNYIDALTDKMKQTGSHQIGDLGTLTRDANRQYAFRLAEGVKLDSGNSAQQPLADVKTFSHDSEPDPFAQFEPEEVPTLAPDPEPEPMPAPKPEPAPAAEPVVEPTPEPKPVAEPTPTPEPAPAPKPEPTPTPAPKPEPTPKQDPEPAPAPKPEPAPIPAPEPEPEVEAKPSVEAEATEPPTKADAPAAPVADDKERRRAEKMIEEERRRAEKKAEEERRHAEEELRKAEKKAKALAAVAARQEAKASKHAEAEAEKARQRAEKEAARQKAEDEKARAKAEKQSRKDAERKAKENKKLADSLLAPATAATPAAANEPKTKKETGERRKRRVMPWLLALLGVLLVGAAVYYLVAVRGLDFKSTASTTTASRNAEHINVSKANSLTYNPDALVYSQREMSLNRDQVCAAMAEYVSDFLASRGYRSARASMMDRIRQYAGQRMEELLGPQYAVQNFIPYDDYLTRLAEPWLRDRRAARSRITVQTELMNYALLDELLDRMVDELGLMPDGSQQKTAEQVKEVKKQEKAVQARRKAATGEGPVYVYVEKNSKQGFDIIAGFYVNKTTAARMTARLHDMGCDAYIIEKDENFYVSMGSAKTRTAAEALYKHIKSWYDGDIVIKEW